MFCLVKRCSQISDDTGMEPSPSASSGRFRRATVVSSSPCEQLRSLLDDGPAASDAFERLLLAAVDRDDAEEVVALVTTMRGSSDRQRTYVALHHGATQLHELATRRAARGDGAWTEPLDAGARLLVEHLAADPHEPELLALLGCVLAQLGDRDRAGRLLAAATALDPEHAQAGVQLEAVRTQLARSRTREDLHDAIDDIVGRAAVMPSARISLCMIVRDEEEMLPACLEAVAPFVDEMIVVDTGSVDRTREIAREHGAQVHEFTWTGNFSEARNETLRHATGDWILWLDADEQLVVEDGEQLRDLARRTWVEGWSVLETHVLGSVENGVGSAMHAPMRLFRRRPEYRWSGAVHEQVAETLPGWVPGRVRASTVRVNHYGYTSDLIAARDKRARNLELLLEQHEDAPSAFTSFNIGTEYSAAAEWTQAHAWFERALVELRAKEGTSWHRQPWAPLLVQRAVTTRRVLGDHSGVLQLAREGLKAWPDYSDLVCEQAQAHLDAHQWDAAAERARTALAMGDAPARYVAVTGKGSFQARHVLALALRGGGDLDAARAELERTVDEAPQYAPALSDLVQLLVDLELAEDEVDAAIDALLGERASSADANLVVASQLHVAGEHDRATARYERVLDAKPGHAQALVSLAELALVRGDLQSAWDLAMDVDPLDRLAPHAAESAFLAAAALDRPDLVDAPARRIAHAESLAAGERAAYVAWKQLIAPEDSVHALVRADADAQAMVMRNLEALARLEATEAFERLHGLLAAVFDDEYQRHLQLAQLYVTLCFPDLAGEEYVLLAQRFGPDAAILTGLGKVATMKDMWEDAHVFFTESLALDPSQSDARQLLTAVAGRCAT